jgi:hypothetical protein
MIVLVLSHHFKLSIGCPVKIVCAECVKKNPPYGGRMPYAAEGHDSHDPDAGQPDGLDSLPLL